MYGVMGVHVLILTQIKRAASSTLTGVMKIFFKLLLTLILFIGFSVSLMIGGAYYWVHQPLTLNKPIVDIRIPPGASPSRVAALVKKAGVEFPPEAFVWLARITGQDKLIKAGGYQVVAGETALSLLDRMANGDVTNRQVTFIEGWNLMQIRAALVEHPDIEQTLSAVTSQTELAQKLNVNLDHLEGWVFPDTYVFPVGATDKEILQNAISAQQRILNQAWANRAADLPLKTPQEALILASIVEKETGFGAERARIAGVFINRLRVGMPLQTDPTVIYGMGEKYQGKIRKIDLQTDTAWNTYTRNGLPPTPIAAVSRASLEAALHPEDHKFYYFVSKGDGTSAFSKDLAEHNRNVSIYILGKKP